MLASQFKSSVQLGSNGRTAIRIEASGADEMEADEVRSTSLSSRR
jgi:hypothetical protein